ncbi:MAG: HsdR family type I site-specific deoxyribonuclease [Methanospirillaceae archaeon]|nr:HsdR family type I site-specific deoxyribonuclease [Methanospirillaceae archaeon]
MSEIDDRERQTQNRVIQLFKKQLGYQYLGNWEDRPDNANVEEEYLKKYLTEQHYTEYQQKKAIETLKKCIDNQQKSLYSINKSVYTYLRYGVPVINYERRTDSIHLIDWHHPEKNHFYLAEEVTVHGKNTKRPDIVLYVNGIALAVIELKRMTVSLSEGIRQNIGNQKPEFIRKFFTTIQIIIAGNETAGLRYGVIETPEKYYLSWKDELAKEKPADTSLLDWQLLSLCRKERFLELIHDFLIYDSGIKKMCRPNQYFGVKAAQKRIQEKQGGIIWHTQGSGKSLTMVWLAKWIRENISSSRILVITDRTELDEQIEGIFKGVKENIYRTTSGEDLINRLNETTPQLICSLIHKFGDKSSTKQGSEEDDEISYDTYVRDMKAHLPPNFRAKGDIFIFVDECHRTQSGLLHDAMRELIPKGIFIGFTGTPLLREDKQTSREKFGEYIHTYKYDQAVKDGVVLDLRYEARDIGSYLVSDGIDKKFETKTQMAFNTKTEGLNEWAREKLRAKLKKRWATIQKINSSERRQRMIVDDILFDMETKPRLMHGTGNALLVVSSIYQACTCYKLFSDTELKGKCAIITSYKPSPGDISKEDSGEGDTEKITQYEIYQKMLADYFSIPPDQAVNKAEEFEKKVKKTFVDEPGQMKLLIVVDKLLTGFDAPSATYLYIDKNMQDHGLFQAICRVNRLDGDEKDYGYIVDYRDLFQSLEESIKDYTSGAFGKFDKEDVKGLLQNRLDMGRERLDKVLEEIRLLCEHVPKPKDTQAYIHYFCGEDTENVDSLKNTEDRRQKLYSTTETLIRAYTDIANEMHLAGYSVTEAKEIKQEVNHYTNIMEAVKQASGDDIDLKIYDPFMRRLIDTYIGAEPAKVRASLPDIPLIDLIIEKGAEGLDGLSDGIKENKNLTAETIERNVRKIILNKTPIDPAYYNKLSEILTTLIKERKAQSENYDDFLDQHIQNLINLAKDTIEPGKNYPSKIDTPAKRALYNNLDEDPDLVLQVFEAITENREDDWPSNPMKTRSVWYIVNECLNDEEKTDRIIDIAKHQPEFN